MLKYFVFCLFFLALNCQAFGEEPIVVPEIQEDDFDISDFNNTAEVTNPQPRFAQLSIKDKIYTFYFQPFNWHAAVELCNSQNLQIATVTSQEESNNLMTYLARYNLLQTDTSFWLGANNLAHGQWTWFNNGYPVMYTNWRYGEPNNYLNREHCVEVLGTGEWNDIDCETRRPVVCQNRPACLKY